MHPMIGKMFEVYCCVIPINKFTLRTTKSNSKGNFRSEVFVKHYFLPTFKKVLTVTFCHSKGNSKKNAKKDILKLLRIVNVRDA